MMNKQSSILLSLKKEPLNIMEIEPEMSENVTLVTGNLMDLDPRPDIHEIKEFKPTISISGNKCDLNSYEANKIRNKVKRGIKRLGEPGALHETTSNRSFSVKWLARRELRDWVTVVPGKPSYVSCKWCKGLLRAHLHDLKKHAISKKHRKHSLTNMNTFTEDNDCVDAYLNNVSNSTEQKFIKKNNENHCETQLTSDNGVEGNIPVNIGFIGCGNMAQALVSGFISSGLTEPSNILVSAPSNKNLVKLKPLGVKTTHDNMRVVTESHMVYLAIKPDVIPEVIAHLEPIESSHNPLFVSMAPGLSIVRLEAMLSHVVSVPRVIRIMPNTASIVLQGCCAYSMGSNVQPSEGRVIKVLFGSMGICEEVQERLLDGLYGSASVGPAYAYAVIEAIADGAVKMGVPSNLAMAMAAQAMFGDTNVIAFHGLNHIWLAGTGAYVAWVKGAGTMVLETGKFPGQLKYEVTSSSAGASSALHIIDERGLKGTLISAVEAATLNSKEIEMNSGNS